MSKPLVDVALIMEPIASTGKLITGKASDKDGAGPELVILKLSGECPPEVVRTFGDSIAASIYGKKPPIESPPESYLWPFEGAVHPNIKIGNRELHFKHIDGENELAYPRGVIAEIEKPLFVYRRNGLYLQFEIRTPATKEILGFFSDVFGERILVEFQAGPQGELKLTMGEGEKEEGGE